MDNQNSGRALKERYVSSHCRRYYRRKRGDQSRESDNISASLDRWLDHVGETLQVDRYNRFQVKAWQDQLVTEGLSRSYINQCLDRLRRWVDWCVDLGLMPETVQGEMRRCRRLKEGCGAKERDMPPPVVLGDFKRICAELPLLARDLLRLLTLTAARPSELLELTNAEVFIERRLIVPIQHKTARRGKVRVIPLNAEAIAIIERHWRPLLPDDPLFPSPARGAKPGEHYSLSAFRATVKRAAKRAGVKHTTPRDARRRVGRHVRRLKGLDAAQALLGHAHSTTTEIYAPLDPGEDEFLPIAREATEVL